MDMNAEMSHDDDGRAELRRWPARRSQFETQMGQIAATLKPDELLTRQTRSALAGTHRGFRRSTPPTSRRTSATATRRRSRPTPRGSSSSRCSSTQLAQQLTATVYGPGSEQRSSDRADPSVGDTSGTSEQRRPARRRLAGGRIREPDPAGADRQHHVRRRARHRQASSPRRSTHRSTTAGARSDERRCLGPPVDPQCSRDDVPGPPRHADRRRRGGCLRPCRRAGSGDPPARRPERRAPGRARCRSRCTGAR